MKPSPSLRYYRENRDVLAMKRQDYWRERYRAKVGNRPVRKYTKDPKCPRWAPPEPSEVP
jgi:hypothetical protein